MPHHAGIVHEIDLKVRMANEKHIENKKKKKIQKKNGLKAVWHTQCEFEIKIRIKWSNVIKKKVKY